MSGSGDPNLEALLSIDAFKDNFDIQDFIANISEKLIARAVDDTGPFDPTPFIDTFESAVDTLLALRRDVQSKKEAMEVSVRAAEKEFSRNITELNTGFESVTKSFGGMEDKISQVGRTAIRIGEQLESIHVSRQRAQAAYDLIDYYNQFSKSDTSRLDSLRKEGGKAGRQQVAVILRRLVTVAKEVDLPGAEETRDYIDKYCEMFEKDMLKLFDKSYRKGDPKMMAHCAQTLLDFNGGNSCVQIYVNQHDFFLAKPNLEEINIQDNIEMWNALCDPDSPAPKSEDGLTALFDEIRLTASQEAQIIQAVFPNPPTVMQVFLQRVFAQSIQQYLELLFTQSQSLGGIPSLGYLRTLHLSHVQVSKLISDLKESDFASILTVRPAPTNGKLEASSVPANASSGAGAAINMSTMLDNAIEEMFVPYTEGSKYVERESKCLAEMYTGFLERFTKANEAATKAKASTLFDRLAQFTTSTSTAPGTGPANNGSNPPATTSSTTASAATAASSFMSRIRGTAASASSTSSPAPPPVDLPANTNSVVLGTSEEDGKLSVDAAEKILRWHAEAVGRCVELSSSGDVPKNAFALMKVLADALTRSYVEMAVEAAQTALDTRDAKVEPDVNSPLSTLKQVDMICHLWQQYVNVALLPLANASVTTRREMSIFNNQTLSRIEGGANGVAGKVVDVVIAWLTLQLNKQKKNDFKPKDDDLSFARVNTEPCEACCETLEKVRDAARENISGKNLEMFLSEIGIAFHTLLLDHMKKFSVNATGGLMLAKDLKTYQDTIGSFSIPSLSERFEFLRQLGNIFLVPPETLKLYITENYLGRVESSLLRPYLAQRVDWAQIQSGFDTLDGTGASSSGTNGGPPDSASGSRGVFRLSLNTTAGSMSGQLKDRLGTMMRDLENLRVGAGESIAHASAAAGSRFSMNGLSSLGGVAASPGFSPLLHK